MSKRNDCPFCGHQHSSIVTPKRFHHKVQVECSKCLACGPLADSAREATDGWNARMGNTPIPHVIEPGTGRESLFGQQS